MALWQYVFSYYNNVIITMEKPYSLQAGEGNLHELFDQHTECLLNEALTCKSSMPKYYATVLYRTVFLGYPFGFTIIVVANEGLE